MIYFDNSSARQEWWPTDRFAASREIFEEFNKCCAKNMYPDDYIAIDEILYPTRGVISFKTYSNGTTCPFLWLKGYTTKILLG